MRAPPRVLIGIFSFNEGPRLLNSALSLANQAAQFEHHFFILDESSDIASRKIATSLTARVDCTVLDARNPRQGKANCMNLLASMFLEKKFDVLLHFDSDLAIDPGCVTELVKVIQGGTDLAAPVSLCTNGRNLFERAIDVMLRPAELQAQSGHCVDPLVGHAGAYSENAVRRIFPIQPSRTHEDLLILAMARRAGLNTLVLPSARVHHQMVNNVDDYLLIARRHFGRLSNFDTLSGRNAGNIVRDVRSTPSIELMARAIAEDLPAAMLLPYVLVLRLAALYSAGPYPTETWDVVQSTKS